MSPGHLNLSCNEYWQDRRVWCIETMIRSYQWVIPQNRYPYCCYGSCFGAWDKTLKKPDNLAGSECWPRFILKTYVYVFFFKMKFRCVVSPWKARGFERESPWCTPKHYNVQKHFHLISWLFLFRIKLVNRSVISMLLLLNLITDLSYKQNAKAKYCF